VSVWYKPPERGMFQYNRPVRIAEVTDGLSNTLLVGDFSHYDPIFDQIESGIGALYTWSWIYTDYSVCFSSSSLNYRVPAEAVTYTPKSAPWWNVIIKRLDAFSSQHPGGVNFVFADGSVRFLKDGNTPQVTLQALSTRGDGDQAFGDF